MVMYENEYKTKENKNWTKDKFEPQHIHYLHLVEAIHDRKGIYKNQILHLEGRGTHYSGLYLCTKEVAAKYKYQKIKWSLDP